MGYMPRYRAIEMCASSVVRVKARIRFREVIARFSDRYRTCPYGTRPYVHGARSLLGRCSAVVRRPLFAYPEHTRERRNAPVRANVGTLPGRTSDRTSVAVDIRCGVL